MFNNRILALSVLTVFVGVASLYAESPNPVGTVIDLNGESREGSFAHHGDHILAELTGCSNLNESTQLEAVLRAAAVAAGATVLSVTVHQFEPFGMTGVAVLQESHISVHTWPEYGYASIDVYTCGTHVHIEKALDQLKKFFEPENVHVVSVKRGFPSAELDESTIYKVLQ